MKKKGIPALLAATLIMTTSMQSFAAGWQQVGEAWYWVLDYGGIVTSAWQQDQEGGWYYYDASGVMVSGWNLLDGFWYFFDTRHEGQFGRALSGWQWIDGYCYYLGEEEDRGRMYQNAVTPDGFTVGESGAWMRNGSYVYEPSKGIQTKPIVSENRPDEKQRPSGGGSSGGSGGGNGNGSGGSHTGDSSNTNKSYSYEVRCIDQTSGELLEKFIESARNQTKVSFQYHIKGYVLSEGQDTSGIINQPGLVFTLYYEPEEKPSDYETDTYTVNFRDIQDDKVLKSVSGSALHDSRIEIQYPEISGYERIENQPADFVLSSDGMTVDVYYRKKKEVFHYTVRFAAQDTREQLGSMSLKAEANSMVYLTFPDFAGYELCEDQSAEYILERNNQTFTIYYLKSEQETATPSEPVKERYSYTVTCTDYATGQVLAVFNDTGAAGNELMPDYEIPGYALKDPVSVTLDQDQMKIQVYYVTKDNLQSYAYTVNCIDAESFEILSVHEEIGIPGRVIVPDYEIDGYCLVKPYEFRLTANGEEFDLYYKKNKELQKYYIYQLDIESREQIGMLVFTGIAGEIIELSGTGLDGYELLGNPPPTVSMSAEESNNYMNLYYKKQTDGQPSEKEIPFRVEFVNSSDHKHQILKDITGVGKLGESIPVYFSETINDGDGNTWTSIGHSPRFFTLDDKSEQIFTIEYQKTGEEPPQEQKQYAYSIRYIAEDTKATLGISTGYAPAGSQISYRNNFPDYGLEDGQASLLVKEDENENHVEVSYQRTMFPGPEKDEITGEYEGCNWLVIFTDSEGHLLLPSVKGFSLKDNRLIIDYPDTIEDTEGNVYRAKVPSPYHEVQKGTSYRQIVISYIKGESSDRKLEDWKNEAQKAKDAFYKKTPLRYQIVYQEKDSWNDIALRVGISPIQSHITIPAVEIDGYLLPAGQLSGFDLTKDGLSAAVSYQRAQGNSSGFIKTGYTIHFKDRDGNSLFDSYEGSMAAPGLTSVMDLPVYYPNTFTDQMGNIWEAEKKSPQIFRIDTLSLNQNSNTVVYNKIYDNPKTDMVVTNEEEALKILEAFAAHTEDTDVKEFYIIGQDYSPKDMAAGDLIRTYNLKGYSNYIADTFDLAGTSYTVCHVSFERSWNASDCNHRWEITSYTEGGCLVQGREVITCSKCKEELETILPALGHVDLDGDTLCDNCKKRAFEQILGDELAAVFDAGALGLGRLPYKFICIDDNYKGTGKMLYISVTDMTPQVYGEYSFNNQADYEASALKYFLNDEFVDGLGGVGSAVHNFNGNPVSMLTKDEYDQYKQDAENRYRFPEGVFLTRTLSVDGQNILLTDGTEVSPKEAGRYPARPLILLDKPDTTEKAQSNAWKIGDIQARTIGGKVYLFRCVNENYKDKTNTSKQSALFLCESVIPADIINDEKTQEKETLFFGANNNYKYSAVRRWLGGHVSDTSFNLSDVNIGVDSSYSGSTQKYGFSQLNSRLLTKYDLDGRQYMTDQLFCLSVEEALSLNDYLWRFGTSGSENPETQINGYCRSYWLRTPMHDTKDMIYTVNLSDGTIEAKSVKATAGSTYSSTGLRPAFVMPQVEE